MLTMEFIGYDQYEICRGVEILGLLRINKNIGEYVFEAEWVPLKIDDLRQIMEYCKNLTNLYKTTHDCPKNLDQ